jgi:hypothetical protein
MTHGTTLVTLKTLKITGLAPPKVDIPKTNNLPNSNA